MNELLKMRGLFRRIEAERSAIEDLTKVNHENEIQVFSSAPYDSTLQKVDELKQKALKPMKIDQMRNMNITLGTLLMALTIIKNELKELKDQYPSSVEIVAPEQQASEKRARSPSSEGPTERSTKRASVESASPNSRQAIKVNPMGTGKRENVWERPRKNRIEVLQRGVQVDESSIKKLEAKLAEAAESRKKIQTKKEQLQAKLENIRAGRSGSDVSTEAEKPGNSENILKK